VFVVKHFTLQYFDISSVFLEPFGAELPPRLKRTRTVGFVAASYPAAEISMWQRDRVVADKDDKNDKDVKCF